jgi:hypothetical protein
MQGAEVKDVERLPREAIVLHLVNQAVTTHSTDCAISPLSGATRPCDSSGHGWAEGSAGDVTDQGDVVVEAYWLDIAAHGMRDVGFFHVFYLILGELDGEGGDGIIQMMRLGCTNDRGGDDRFGKNPGHGNLRHRHAACLGHFVNPLCDRKVFFLV